MRRLAGLIVVVAFSFVLGACNNTETANTNTNANANLNANVAPTPVANTNTNRELTREEYERNKERYQREAKGSGRTIGTGVNDGWLWVKTRFDLAAADDLRDSTINVDVDNSVVTLTGTVANATQRTKADQVAKAVDGVKSVKNELKIAANTNANTANTNANHNANHNANANRNANR